MWAISEKLLIKVRQSPLAAFDFLVESASRAFFLKKCGAGPDLATLNYANMLPVAN
jgi:hypothetical protein